MNIGHIIGLIFFVVGVLVLVFWSINTQQNSGALLPGIILTAAGIITLWLMGRSSN